MQDRMEEDHKKGLMFSSEAMKRLDARERELLEYRELIQQQEKQLDEYRARLKHEQLAREKEIQRQQRGRESFLDAEELVPVEEGECHVVHVLLHEGCAESARGLAAPFYSHV